MNSYPQRQPGSMSRAAGHVWEGMKRVPATTAELTCTGVGVFHNAEFASQFGTAAVALAVASDVLKALSGPTLMRAVRCAFDPGGGRRDLFLEDLVGTAERLFDIHEAAAHCERQHVEAAP